MNDFWAILSKIDIPHDLPHLVGKLSLRPARKRYEKATSAVRVLCRLRVREWARGRVMLRGVYRARARGRARARVRGVGCAC